MAKNEMPALESRLLRSQPCTRIVLPVWSVAASNRLTESTAISSRLIRHPCESLESKIGVRTNRALIVTLNPQ